MYGKIFESIYDGTLAEDWRALITFQQFIVLSDADGMVDMTPSAISRRTGIPIKAGIEILECADPYSRTEGEDGRRLELIDSHRPWGWHIVNHNKYKSLQDSDTVREQTRERVRKHREKKRQEACNANVTDGNGLKRHKDKDKDIDIRPKPLSSKLDEPAKKIITYLNEKSGKNFRPVESNLKFVQARLHEGHSDEDIRWVVDVKVSEWKGGDMDKYLRPSTLFCAEKFNQYIGEKTTKPRNEFAGCI